MGKAHFGGRPRRRPGPGGPAVGGSTPGVFRAVLAGSDDGRGTWRAGTRRRVDELSQQLSRSNADCCRGLASSDNQAVRGRQHSKSLPVGPVPPLLILARQPCRRCRPARDVPWPNSCAFSPAPTPWCSSAGPHSRPGYLVRPGYTSRLPDAQTELDRESADDGPRLAYTVTRAARALGLSKSMIYDQLGPGAWARSGSGKRRTSMSVFGKQATRRDAPESRRSIRRSVQTRSADLAPGTSRVALCARPGRSSGPAGCQVTGRGQWHGRRSRCRNGGRRDVLGSSLPLA